MTPYLGDYLNDPQNRKRGGKPSIRRTIKSTGAQVAHDHEIQGSPVYSWIRAYCRDNAREVRAFLQGSFAAPRF